MRSVTLLLGFTSVVSQLPRSFATAQQLPNQIYNVTAVEPPSLPLTTVNFTITDTITASITEIVVETSTLLATTTETTTLPPPSPPVSTLTVIYPSSDAAPVEVTSISQVVTSYIPEATFCLGPALYFSSVSGGPFTNGSANVTQYLSGTSSCSVEYSTTTTTVCATTITGLASKITVSYCDQEITFSSECGYSLETPTPTATAVNDANQRALITPAPTVRRLMTYYLAPWQSLTDGSAPSDVDVKICTALDNGTQKCQRYQEVWEIIVVTSTRTTSYPVTFSQTLEGPGALIVGESTSYINSTTEVVSLSKTLRLETEVEIESTSVSTRPWSTVRVTQQQTSYLTVTRQLERVSSSIPVPTDISSPAEVASSSADTEISSEIPDVEPSAPEAGGPSTITTTTTLGGPSGVSPPSPSTPSPSSESSVSEGPSTIISTTTIGEGELSSAVESQSSSAEPTTTVVVTSFVTERRTSTITLPRSRTVSARVGIA